MDGAYLVFLLCGAAQLFPWCSLITAADFWEMRYPGKHTDRLLTATYLPANLAVVLAMVLTHGRLRPRVRVVGGLLGFTAAIIAVILLGTREPTDRTLAMLLSLVAICGCCDGLVGGALFSEAASLAPRYAQAVVAGTAISGLAVSVLRILTKATLPATPEGMHLSAELYFAAAAAVCLSCAALYGCALPRLAAVREARAEALDSALEEALLEWESGDEDEEDAEQPEIFASSLPITFASRKDSEGSFRGGSLYGGSPIPSWTQPSPWGSLRPKPVPPHLAGLNIEVPPPEAPHPPQYPLAGQPRMQRNISVASLTSYRSVRRIRAAPPATGGATGGAAGGGGAAGRSAGTAAGGAGAAAGSAVEELTSGWVFRRIWPLALSNMLIFTVTLSIFPGVLAEDEHSRRLGSWYPILLIATFNVGDWVGKSLPGWATFRLSKKSAILPLSLLRLLFVPAFRLAAMRHEGPAVVFALTLSLGLTNGYLLGCSMMRGPACVPPAAAHLAGNLLVLFMVLGLCAGAGASFLWLLYPLLPPVPPVP